MPKNKTHSGTKKRIKVTGSGKLTHAGSGKRHNLEKKSTKMTRRMDLLGLAEQDRPRARSAAAGVSRAPAAAPRPVGARVCEVAPGRVEASATVLCDGRARAFALRLERRISRWKVTSVEIG